MVSASDATVSKTFQVFGFEVSRRFGVERRILRRLEAIPTRSGSTLIMALRASWNVNGCSETGFAFGIEGSLQSPKKNVLYKHFERLACDLLGIGRVAQRDT